MSVNHPQVRKQKLIWSSIRNKLNISLHQENLLEIQTMNQIIREYEKGELKKIFLNLKDNYEKNNLQKEKLN